MPEPRLITDNKTAKFEVTMKPADLEKFDRAMAVFKGGVIEQRSPMARIVLLEWAQEILVNTDDPN